MNKNCYLEHFHVDNMKHLSKFLVHGNNILVFHEKKSYFDKFGSVNSFSVISAGIFPNLIEVDFRIWTRKFKDSDKECTWK